jgi:hypothetical protein
VFHVGPPTAELANRVHPIELPHVGDPPGDAVTAPTGRYRFLVRNPDTKQPGPWGAALVVDGGNGRRHGLLIEDVGAPIAPRWLDGRLIFLRIVWGRSVFSDLIFDAASGTLPYHEQAEDGRAAFEQYQAACRGRCPCNVDAATDPDHPARFTVNAPLPTALPGSQAMLGLLELPGIFGPPEQGGVVPAHDPRPLAVYAEPDAERAPMARPIEMAHFEHREYTYEGAAAVVYARRPGWFAIGLRGLAWPRGWIRADEAGQFHDIADLLRFHLSYLNAHWDGHLWSAPVGGLRTTEPSMRVAGHTADASDQHPMQVLETRVVAGGLWLRIETFDESPCNVDTPAVLDRGWIPAFSASGALVAGYYSRGC